MIGFTKHGDAIRELQESSAASVSQITALSTQLATLSSQAANAVERSASVAIETEELKASMAELRDLLAAQAQVLRDQAQQLTQLKQADEQRQEQLLQLRGDLLRVERQAAIDLGEVRRTSSALAESLLLPGHRDTAPAANGIEDRP